MVRYASRPPAGIMTVAAALPQFLPTDWAIYQEALKCLEQKQIAYREPIGGRRSPETDERRIDGAKFQRAEVLKKLRQDVETALRNLVDGMHNLLRTGELVAYVVPDNLVDDFVALWAEDWSSIRLTSISKGSIQGDRHGGKRVVVAPNPGSGEASRRQAGRPSAPARVPLMEEYARRRDARELQRTQLGKARSLVKWLSDVHPYIEHPDLETVTKWIRETEGRTVDTHLGKGSSDKL